MNIKPKRRKRPGHRTEDFGSAEQPVSKPAEEKPVAKTHHKHSMSGTQQFIIMLTVCGLIAIAGLYGYIWLNPLPADETTDAENAGSAENFDGTPTYDDPNKLMSIIYMMGRQEGSVPVNDREHFQRERMDAAENLIKYAETDDHRAYAVKTKLESLVKLEALGVKGARDQLDEFARKYYNSDLKDLAIVSRKAVMSVEIGNALDDPKTDLQPVFDEVETTLQDYKNDDGYAVFVRNFVASLLDKKRNADARKLIELALPYYQDSTNENMQDQVQFLEGTLFFDEHNLVAVSADLAKNKPGAKEKFEQIVKDLIAAGKVTPFTYLQSLTNVRVLEKTRHYDLARDLNLFLREQFKNVSNQEIARQAVDDTDAALTRLALVGKRIDLSGYDTYGKPFDTKVFDGNITVLVFFSFRNQVSIQVMDSLVRRFGADRQRQFILAGFVVGEKPWEQIFLMKSEFPHWSLNAPIISPTEKAHVPVPKNRFGIQTAPYIVLLDRDQIVQAIDVVPSVLLPSIKKLTEESKKKSTTEDSGSQTAPDTADQDKQNVQAQFHGENTQYISIRNEPEQDTDNKQIDDQKKNDDQTSADDNPYLAPQHWSTADLVDFVLGMETKPRSIRKREPFALAIVDAADRILADPKSKKYHKRVAALGKTEIVHEHACLGNEKFDELLVSFIKAKNLPDDKRVKSEIDFLTLEQKVLQGSELKIEDEEDIKKVSSIIKESKAFFENNELTNRHLRLASTTIEMVNLLNSTDANEEKELAEQRDSYFKEFGKLFSKSEDRRLAKYGKYLAKSKASPSALVGKPLVLAGQTVAGNEFDWKSYREKIVVVDFWATWCGPCRREMPHVKDLYEKLNAQGFEVVGVSLDDDVEAVELYVQEEKIPWENIVGGKAKELAQEYGVKGIPTMMLVDREGNVLAVANRIGNLKAEIEKQFKIK